MSDQKSYTCICGKIFDNPQKFNGHKANCKAHLLNKYGNLDSYTESRKRGAKKLSAYRTQIGETNKLTKFDQWLSEQHTCELCGKVMTAYYGSGRFCSVLCAKSFATKDKRNIINAQVSNTLKLKFNHTVSCIHCGASIIVGIDRYLDNCICLSCINAQRELRKQNKLMLREEFAIHIKLSESPYSEFDTAYLNSNDTDGQYYYLVKHDDNNAIVKRAKVPLYRYNIEMELNRHLKSSEIIHHIDGNHLNDDRSNLIVLTRSIHNKLHHGHLTLKEILDNHLYIYK